MAVRVLAALAAFLLLAVGGQAATNATILVQPGQSWDAAYDAAAAGDVIELASGAHGNQVITGNKQVTIRAAAGAAVTATDVDVRASGLTLQGPMVVRDLSTSGGSGARVTGATVQNITVNSQNRTATPGYVANCWDCTWRNIDIGFAREANALLMIDGGYPSAGSVKNLLIVDSYFHDIVLNPGSSVHSQCIWHAAQGTRIVNTRFSNCSTFDVFVSEAGGSASSGVTLEGNQFGKTFKADGSVHFYTVRSHPVVGQPFVRVAQNHFELVMSVGGGTPTGPEFCGNTGSLAASSWGNACSGSPPPPPSPAKQCADGQDNDGDGRVDLNDPGCADAADDNEADDPAPPPPPPSGCDAACEQAYKDNIAALNAQVASLTAERDSARAARDAALSKLADIHELSAP